jgi:hypothetical protein
MDSNSALAIIKKTSINLALKYMKNHPVDENNAASIRIKVTRKNKKIEFYNLQFNLTYNKIPSASQTGIVIRWELSENSASAILGKHYSRGKSKVAYHYICSYPT